jgi:acyl-CoA dehydrogenase
MSANTRDYHERLSAFMTEYVFPAEATYESYRSAAGPDDHSVPPIIEELKTKAKARGLWNLFLPAASGLTILEYAPLAELSGWSVELAPEALNCSAPDSGITEILHMFGSDEQRERWLQPLLDGAIRSAFSMTEPAVASSDARNIETTIASDGAAGIGDDTPLARLYGLHRAMRIFDGPDEVHMRTVARTEIGREKTTFAMAVT